MMILASIFKTKQIITLYLSLFALVSYFIYLGDFIVSAAIFVTLIGTLFISHLEETNSNEIFHDNLLEQIKNVLAKAVNGEFSHRITGIDEQHTMRSIATDVNTLLHKIEEMHNLSFTKVQLNEIVRDKISQATTPKILTPLQRDIGQDLSKLKTLLNDAKATDSQDVGQSIVNNLEQLIESITVSTDSIIFFNQKIYQITNATNLIKELIDKTNAVAFHTAIQAARSGEYGKVNLLANEVRNLAQKTQKATQEITLSTNSLKQEISEIEIESKLEQIRQIRYDLMHNIKSLKI